jgi:flagellar hook-length control protein FliK
MPASPAIAVSAPSPALPASVASTSASSPETSASGLNFSDRLALMLLAINARLGGAALQPAELVGTEAPTTAAPPSGHPSETAFPSDLSQPDVARKPAATAPASDVVTVQPEQPSQTLAAPSADRPSLVDLATVMVASGLKPSGPGEASAAPSAGGETKTAASAVRKSIGKPVDDRSVRGGAEASVAGDLPLGTIPLQPVPVLMFVLPPVAAPGQKDGQAGPGAAAPLLNGPAGIPVTSAMSRPNQTTIATDPVQRLGDRVEGAAKSHQREVSDDTNAPALPPLTSDAADRMSSASHLDGAREFQPQPSIATSTTDAATPTSTQASGHTAGTPAAQIAPALVALTHAPDGAQRMTLRLQPSELGHVEIRIDRPADGPARVEITVEHPETLTLLLRDQPQLQRALDQAGVPPDGRSVTFHVASGGSSSNAGDQIGSSQTGSNPAHGDSTWSGGDNGGTGGNTSRQGGGGGSGSLEPDPDQPMPYWLRAGLDITA